MSRQSPTCRPDKCRTTRRDVLQWGAAGAAWVTVQPAVGQSEPPSNWIDAHAHIWTPDTKKFPLADGFTEADMQPPSFTPAELMVHARRCGINRVVLIQMSFYRYDNSYMLQAMQDHPGTYAGVAVIDENDDPATHMKELAESGVRGFRIRPGDRRPDDWLSGQGMRAMWQCGADEGLAMCHLINPEFLPSVERMCQKFPGTPVVIDHFARIGIDGRVRTSDVERLCRLARFPQITVKVSAYYALGEKKAPYNDLGPMIQRLKDAYGAERLMWASDCPFQVQNGHTYQASVDLIRSHLDFLTPSDREWILRKTAERVFFS